MKRKNDPFSGIKITPQSGKQSFVFDYRPSIKIRFTLNPTTSAGYLARGTIGLLDPQTGHLLQTHTNSKERRFSDAATLELYVPYPRPGTDYPPHRNEAHGGSAQEVSPCVEYEFS